jgi:hypothetical protein
MGHEMTGKLKMRKLMECLVTLVVAGVTCCLSATIADAQCSGVFTSGNVCANSSASSGVAGSTPTSTLLDRVLGSMQGMVAYRGASAWTALLPSTAGYPFLTGGPAANPSFNILGLSAGGLGGSQTGATVGQIPVMNSDGTAYTPKTMLFSTTVEAWGAAGDCVTDDSPAITAAISYINSTYNSGTVLFGSKCYAIGSTINLGNGSAAGGVATLSTVNGIHLVGISGSNGNLPGTPISNGTYLKWIGPASTTTPIVQINGPSTGNDLSHIVMDANGTAGLCLNLVSAGWGIFNDLKCMHFTTKGIQLTAQLATSISGGGSTSYLAITKNKFQGLLIIMAQGAVSDTASGLVLDGYLGAGGIQGGDTTVNTFRDIQIEMKAGLTTTQCGIYRRFEDGNIFDGQLAINENGVGNKGICNVYVIPSGGGLSYPAGDIFNGYVYSLYSASIDTSSGATSNSSSFLGYMPEAGPLNYPNDPNNAPGYFIYQDQLYPVGGMWGIGGNNFYNLTYKNLILNSQFVGAGLGSSISGTLNNSAVATLDNWFLEASGITPYTVTKVRQTPGNTLGPFNLANYMKIQATGTPSGNSYFHTYTLIPGVQNCQNENCTFSVWLWTDSGTITLPANVALTQFFGTGGAPSPSIGVSSSVQSPSLVVTTTPKQFRFSFLLPSISGKTLGTAGDDGLYLFLSLPVNTALTLNVGLPQFEEGGAITAYDRRNPLIDLLLNGTPTGTGIVVRQTSPTITTPTITGVASLTGSVLITENAAPGAPAGGLLAVWADSTDGRLHDKNPANAIGTTVVANSGAVNEFLTAISTAGVVSRARPSCGNLSDSSGGCSMIMGANVQTALGVAVGSNGAFVVRGDDLGTPSAGVITNLTGTANININGTVGATTPNTGAFTTITANTSISATVSSNSVQRLILPRNSSNGAGAATLMSVGNDAGTTTAEFGVTSSTNTSYGSGSDTLFLGGGTGDFTIRLNGGTGEFNLYVNSGTKKAFAINGSTADTSILSTSDATTSTSGGLRGAGGASFAKRVWTPGLTTSAANQTAYVCLSSGGELISDSTTCLASSARFKNIISNEYAASTQVLNAKVWSYIREPNSVFAEDYYRERIGFIAEDVAKLDSRLVEFDKEHRPLKIDYNGLLAVLFTQLKADNDNLREEIRKIANRR